MTRLSLLSAVLVLAACAGETVDSDEPIDPTWLGEPEISWIADGAPDVAQPEIPWLEQPGGPAELPDLGPCADGWRSIPGEGGVSLCEPWPDSGALTCDGAQVQWAGSAQCVDLGPTCPEDGWPADLPDSDVVYVHPDGAGDGSREAPFGTVADAVASGAGTIALSTGDHPGGVRLSGRVDLVGACASTRLVCDSCTGPTLTTTGEHTVRDLTLASHAGEGLIVDGGSTTVQDVAIAGAPTVGVEVRDGRLDGARVLVRDAVFQGVIGLDGTEVSLDDLVVERTSIAGVTSGGGTMSLVRPVIREIGPNSSTGENGHSALVDHGSLTLTDAVLEGAARSAIFSTAGILDLDGVLIRDIAPYNGASWGIIATSESVVTARHLRGESFSHALVAAQYDTVATVEDSYQVGGAGVGAYQGGDVQVERLYSSSPFFALLAKDGKARGSHVTCVRSCGYIDAGGDFALAFSSIRGDFLVEDGTPYTLEDSELRYRVMFDSDVTLRRVVSYGQLIARANVTLEDVVARPAETQGNTSLSIWGGTVQGERIRVESEHSAGVYISDAVVDLADVTVRDGGFYLADGEATVERLSVEGATEAGLASNLRTTLTVTDASFRDPDPTPLEHCPDCPKVGAHLSGKVELTRVAFDGGEPDFLISGGRVTCTDVEVAGDAMVQFDGELSGDRCAIDLQRTQAQPSPRGL